MAYREEALAFVRKTNGRRWLKANRYTRNHWRAVAAVAGITLFCALAWQFSPYGYGPGQYRTGIGEQRIIALEDHSRMTLDAATRLRVHYSSDARIVELQEGQAQFSVAKDPARPFKVIAGDHTIVALGTVFMVEYVDKKIHVAMMEGEVAVIPEQSHSAESPATPNQALSPPASSPVRFLQRGSSLSSEAGGRTIELSAGQELRVNRNGEATITPKADMEAATAWREGKVILRAETLGEAAQRLNRYSSQKIEIDNCVLAGKHISGVFETGDTQGFVSAVKHYFPVIVEYSDPNTVKLKLE